MAAPVIHLGSWTVRRTGCAAGYCAVSCTAKPTATKCEERWRRRPWISILFSQCPPRRVAATQTASVPAACQTTLRVRSPVPSSLCSRDSTRGCGCKCDENPSADLWGWKKNTRDRPMDGILHPLPHRSGFGCSRFGNRHNKYAHIY